LHLQLYHMLPLAPCQEAWVITFQETPPKISWGPCTLHLQKEKQGNRMEQRISKGRCWSHCSLYVGAILVLDVQMSHLLSYLVHVHPVFNFGDSFCFGFWVVLVVLLRH
jgi:hypothetical protein